MNTILNEKPVSFKELEKKIFDCICDCGREIAKGILEKYDDELERNRDKKA